jgi:hypothetical protein
MATPTSSSCKHHSTAATPVVVDPPGVAAAKVVRDTRIASQEKKKRDALEDVNAAFRMILRADLTEMYPDLLTNDPVFSQKMRDLPITANLLLKEKTDVIEEKFRRNIALINQTFDNDLIANAINAKLDA